MSIVFMIGFLVVSGIVLNAIHVHFGLFLLGCAVTFFMSKRKGENPKFGSILFWGVISALVLPMIFGLIEGALKIGFVVLGILAVIAFLRFISNAVGSKS